MRNTRLEMEGKRMIGDIFPQFFLTQLAAYMRSRPPFISWQKFSTTFQRKITCICLYLLRPKLTEKRQLIMGELHSTKAEIQLKTEFKDFSLTLQKLKCNWKLNLKTFPWEKLTLQKLKSNWNWIQKLFDGRTSLYESWNPTETQFRSFSMGELNSTKAEMQLKSLRKENLLNNLFKNEQTDFCPIFNTPKNDFMPHIL